MITASDIAVDSRKIGPSVEVRATLHITEMVKVSEYCSNSEEAIKHAKESVKLRLLHRINGEMHEAVTKVQHAILMNPGVSYHACTEIQASFAPLFELLKKTEATAPA